MISSLSPGKHSDYKGVHFDIIRYAPSLITYHRGYNSCGGTSVRSTYNSGYTYISRT